MTRKIFQPLIGSLLAASILILVFSLGFFESWQWQLTDKLFTTQSPSGQIIIVAIDDKSIQEIGQWPWPRSVHAQLIEKLKDARVIGLDISFLEPSSPNEDAVLASAITKNGRVVLAAEKSGSESLLPIEIFSKNARIGFINTIADPDGITRRVNLKQSFATQITQSPLSQTIHINFSGPPHTFPYFSYSDILNDKILLETFKDKIVLVGATAPDLHDDQMTSVSSGVLMPGVEIQANIIATILDNNFLAVEKTSTTLLIITLISVLASIVFTSTGIVLSAVIAIVGVITYLAWAVISFDQGIIRNLIYPPLAILLTFLVSVIYKYFSEYKQKIFIKKAFGKYVSPKILTEILADPTKLTLGGEKRTMTVLFSDIVGFTSISESTPPKKLAFMLNNYLTIMSRVILKHNGVLDKYIGDAIMAFWGAPIKQADHALLACRAALEMQKVGKNSPFKMRIGINTGEMVVGNMGSHERFDYTVLGDNVNLASRLEGINKKFGTKIIISQSTYDLVKDNVKARKLGKVTVKGKKQKITIYELLDL